MKLKFVSDEEISKISVGKASMYNWAEFIEELYKYPNQWAEFPQKVPSPNSAYRLRDIYNDIEVKVSGGNWVAASHPDKKHWTVYIRYVPQDDTF